MIKDQIIVKMILIKFNNDRNYFNTFIEDIETKVFNIVYIHIFILIQG